MQYCECFKQDKFLKSAVVDLVTVLMENMKNIEWLIDVSDWSFLCLSPYCLRNACKWSALIKKIVHALISFLLLFLMVNVNYLIWIRIFFF